MARWHRTLHDDRPRPSRYFGYDVSPGVEVRPGKGGSTVYALKQGVPVAADPTQALLAELEAQKRARGG